MGMRRQLFTVFYSLLTPVLSSLSFQIFSDSIPHLLQGASTYYSHSEFPVFLIFVSLSSGTMFFKPYTLTLLGAQ